MIYSKSYTHGTHGVEVTGGRLNLTPDECERIESGRPLIHIIGDRGKRFRIEIKTKELK